MDTHVANIFFYHGLIVLGELILFLVFVHMLYKRRSAAGIIAWLLAIILIPYVAVLLYLIIGSRKRKNRYKKEHLKLKTHTETCQNLNPINDVLRSYGIADAKINKKFELYTDSYFAHKEFIGSIENAKSSIYISTYILEYDDVTRDIIESLAKKAQEGVDVKILLDSLGSWKLYFFTGRLRKLIDLGVEVEFFMPIFRMPFRNYINLRNHRKIFIFDNTKVLSGGMNISKDYFEYKAGKSRWEDILFCIEGSSVEQYFEIFASDWFYASSKELRFSGDAVSQTGEALIQVVPSGPDMSKDVLYEALLCAIYSAKKRIWIVTPYFIPDDSIVQALIIAKHKGLEVKLITPKETNHTIVNLTRASYMRELQDVGIDVSLYNGAMLHAKAILFDNESVMLGSVNLDNRSLFLNYEVATFVYSHKVIKDVETWMEKLTSNSSINVNKIPGYRRVMENFMRVIAPQL